MLNPRPSELCKKCNDLYPDEKKCPCVCHEKDVGDSRHYSIHFEGPVSVEDNNNMMGPNAWDKRA